MKGRLAFRSGRQKDLVTVSLPSKLDRMGEDLSAKTSPPMIGMRNDVLDTA